MLEANTVTEQEAASLAMQRGEIGAGEGRAALPRLFHCMTESSPLSMIAVDGATLLVHCVNPAFCLLAGKTRQELVGKPFAEVVPEEKCDTCLALIERVYRTGISESIAGQEHTRPSSPPAYWSYTMWAAPARGGGTAGVIIYVADTTESTFFRRSSERMNREIREINQALVIVGIREDELAEAAEVSRQQLFQAQKMESIGRLAGGIAHDFNNLLTAILGFTELAEDALRPDDEVQDYLHHIQEAAERAANLTGQLLAFARKQIIEPKIVSLNSLVMDIDRMLQRLIGAHIDLALLLHPDAGQIKIDPGQFGQTLMNLVVNARDAMPDGGTITIETRNVTLHEYETRHWEQSASGDYVLLTVSDTGRGIAEEIKAHLFEPFFTTKEQGKGTGLGLATCYGIVKQSGGQIRVESAPGKGTTFHIYLPRQAEATLPVQQAKVSTRPQAAGTILLVEDEPMVREVEVQILRHQGYTVVEAENGIEALQLMAAYPGTIDLLVTDVVMPQMGGRELADQLRVTRPNVKVLYTSGYTDDAIVQQGLLNPGLSFLHKPFLSAALLQKVREVLLSE